MTNLREDEFRGSDLALYPLLLYRYAFEDCLSKRHKKLQDRNRKICSGCKRQTEQRSNQATWASSDWGTFGKVLPSIRPKATD